MPSNVAVAIELSDQERVQLEAWTRRTLIDFARDSLKPTVLAATQRSQKPHPAFLLAGVMGKSSG
jgi:hypothetical protein